MQISLYCAQQGAFWQGLDASQSKAHTMIHCLSRHSWHPSATIPIYSPSYVANAFWCILLWMARGFWNTQWRSIVSVKTADGVHTVPTWWSVETVSQRAALIWMILFEHFSSASKKVVWCYWLLSKKATTQHATERMCAHASVKSEKRTCHFPVWAVALLCIVWEGTIILYMVAVQHIYSLPIYLTATKACRLTGLPAATLNEELDPASVCVCECVCACTHVCVRARMSVCSWVCL